MAWGESFGAFAGGMSDGYSTGKSIRVSQQRRRQPEVRAAQPAIPAYQPQVRSDADTSYEDQSWQMLRDLAAQQPDDGGDEITSYSASTQQQSNNGMSISPDMIKQFMPSSGAGAGSSTGFGSLSLGGGSAGLGGSGLIGSASGATSAASTGGASFGLGGSLVGGTGTVGGSTFAAGAGGGAAAGGSAAGGAAAGGSAGGGIAAGGPWAALAAAIITNEKYQKKKGNRSEGSKYWTDLITGNKIVERDADTLGEKVDKGNKIGIKGDWQVAGDITSFDFSNAFKNLKNTTGVKTIKKLFGG